MSERASVRDREQTLRLWLEFFAAQSVLFLFFPSRFAMSSSQ
jgi:hypothetical protein